MATEGVQEEPVQTAGYFAAVEGGASAGEGGKGDLAD